MTESTLQTPCLIAFCEEIPDNIDKIFNGADIEEYSYEHPFFSGAGELNHLSSLVETYDEAHYSHALVIRNFTDSHRMMAKLNGNLNSIFVFENKEKLELMVSLFRHSFTPSDCEEKISECISHLSYLQNFLCEKIDDSLLEHSRVVFENLEGLQTDFEVYQDHLRKLFNYFKV